MTIPIANIYYLLCYAWDKLDERDLVKVDAASFKDLPNLFSKVLANGLKYLFKKGLDRNYRETSECYPGVKGKLNISESLKQMTFPLGRAVCTFDDFDYDVLQNQILKATLRVVLDNAELN
jgi:5-methylcytosine-specific restriction enzyme subunit McrC